MIPDVSALVAAIEPLNLAAADEYAANVMVCIDHYVATEILAGKALSEIGLPETANVLGAIA